MAFAVVELGLSPREVWRSTYREIMPALRVKRTGNDKVYKYDMTGAESIADIEAKIRINAPHLNI